MPVSVAAIERGYLAYYGRPAENAGLQYWLNAGAAAADERTFVQNLSQTQIWADVKAQGTTFVLNTIYQNLFGRAVDVAGLNYWVQQIALGNTNLDKVGADIAFAALNLPASSTDRQTLEARTQGAISFTNALDTAAEIANYAAAVNSYDSATKTFTNSGVGQAQAFVQSIGTTAPTTAEVDAAVTNATTVVAPGQTFTLTTGADALTGTANNDVFVATGTTLNAGDVIDGSGGSDLLRYSSAGTGGISQAGFVLKDIETIQITSDRTASGVVFDFTDVSGVQTIRNVNSSGDVKINGLKTLVPTIEISGVAALDRATNIADTQITFDASAVGGTADALQLNVSSNRNTDGSRVGTVTVNGIEILNVKSSGSASAFDALASNTLREMNITGDANLTLAGATFANTSAVNVVNAKDFTGNLNITLSNSGAANIDVAVTGGKGNDRANFSKGFDKNDAFDGGDGTDTLALTNAKATVINPADFGTVKNVEVLEITDGGANTVDLANFPGVTTVYYSNSLVGATTVQNAASGITVKVNNPNGQNLTTTLKADGAADTVNLQFESLATAGEAVGVVAADKFEVVNIDVRDDAKDAGVGKLTITQLAVNAATALNITGDAHLVVINDGNPGTPVLSTLNAKDLTGDLKLSGVDFAKGATITLGSGNDTFEVAVANGADTITLGAGKDRIVYSAVTQSNKNMDVITDFVSGEDVVDVRGVMGGIGVASSAQWAGNRASFAQAQGALSGLTADAVFQQDEQILWVDSNADGTLDNNDFRVQLKGVTSLTAADLGFGVGNTVNLTAAGAVVNDTTKTKADNFTTVEDDVINSKAAFLIGSQIDAKGGTDVLNIKDVYNLNGGQATTVTFAGIEQVNLLQGAAAGSVMVDGQFKIVSSAATTMQLGAGNQTYVGSDAIDNISTGVPGIYTIQTGGGNDTITLLSSGANNVDAGDGDDTINGGNTVTAATSIKGGTGTDTLNVTDPIALNALDGVREVEVVNITLTANTTLTPVDDVVAAGAKLAVNITAGTSANLTFNGGSETDGSFTFTDLGTMKDHVMTGGAKNDVFAFGLNTGDVTLNGGAGDDTFNMGNFLTIADHIDGGPGTDTLKVINDTAVTDLDNVTNVEIINIFNTNLTSYKPVDGLIAAGKTLTINALGTNGVKLDFSNELDGKLVVTTSGEALTVTGGALADTVTGGAGIDTFTIAAGATVSKWDTLVNWNFDTDLIDIPGPAPRVTLLTIAGAGVDESTLVAAMQATVNAANPATCWNAANDVVVFTVNGGALNGNVYLAVNDAANTTVSNADYFVRLVGFSGTIDTSDFT